MLSKEENELLTRVGPGTPTGELLRQYWHPVLYTYELAEKDGDPVRVRLLGESLVAFRDSAGSIGLLQENCPHRGASLFLGRNEHGGLRCVYHAWKFDTEGRCVEMPNEPPENDFKHKVRARAYPCRESGGIVWAFLGKGTPPGLPDLEWIHLPESHRFMTKRYHECNWAQALEGDLDSSHVGFLHSALDKSVPGFGKGQLPDGSYDTIGHNRQPRIEAQETDFGLWVAARRPRTKELFYWRATALVMPYYAMIPPSGDAPIHVNLWQPMDDENTLVWSIQYHGGRALNEGEMQKLRSGLYEHYGPEDALPPSSEAGGRWRARASRANDFEIDRKAQRQTSFTGLRGFWRQDRAVTESMGRIYDRSQEHLGPSDVGVLRFRRMLLKAVKAFAQDGTLPPAIDPGTHRVRAVALLLPEGASWEQAVAERSVARPDNWLPGP
jgi:phthalate 4,5-dioxygenase oxygenase subunit